MSRKKPDLSGLRDRWPSSVVVREKVGDFSGNILNPGTIANWDAEGRGPKGRFRINGKRIAYPVDSLIEFLEEHSELVDDGEEKS